jgi:YHS domain-containing protein
MRKIFYGCIAAGLFLASCNNQATNSENSTQPAPPEKKTIELKLSDLGSTKDHVCGMELEEGGIADTTTYEGKIYGFCASECKAEFVKEPAKYLSEK